MHTPGPWIWFDYPDGRKLLAGDTKAVIHCPDAPMSVDDADQRLISAAPDLLKVARASWHLCQSLLAEREGATDDFLQEIATALAAAIAKAEGRS